MDGYRILNFRNFRIKVGYGYANIFSDMDQELKNQYPLTSVVELQRNWATYTYLSENWPSPKVLLRLEIPSGICAKLRTVAASNNRVHMP